MDENFVPGPTERSAQGNARTFDPYPPELATCRLCPRLAEYRERVAREKRKAYKDEEYWGAPVPGFGDPKAKLVLVGLAPGAHGSNRTGRMFTGDASGDFLYPALHRAGLASGPKAINRFDGLTLKGVWITAALRCVPPGNKPERQEILTCQKWLEYDLDGLTNARVALAIGKIGHDAALTAWRSRGLKTTFAAHKFSHGAVHDLGRLPGAAASSALTLVDVYHVSFQNTNTGRLTEQMFDEVLARAMKLAGL
ncbi:MAG TPA: uracil-DNA glycosylase [Trueperaceae bacterium]|nr:uracil-DNA glycosylase [Trueperaceae bacterium]